MSSARIGPITKWGRKKNTITVAKAGGDYDTIPKALASITDADSDNIYLILVYPGIYSENFTMKDCVDIKAVERCAVTIDGDVTVTVTDESDCTIILNGLRFDNNTITIVYEDIGTRNIKFCNCEFTSTNIMNVSGTRVIIDVNDEAVRFFNCINSGTDTFNNVAIDSQRTLWENGWTSINRAYFQHFAAEINGTVDLSGTTRTHIRSASTADAEVEYILTGIDADDYATLVIDNESYTTSLITNNTGTDAAVEVLTGFSAGVISPIPDFTDNGDGSITIGDLFVFIYDNTINFGMPRRYEVTGDTFTLTDQQSNYITVNYNNNSPILQSSVIDTANSSDIIPIFDIFRDGNELHTIDWNTLGDGLANKLQRYMTLEQRVRISEFDKVIIGEDTGRVVTLTSGLGILGCSVPINFDAFRSDTDDWYFYYNLAGVWTQDTGTTQYNNTQYDDGTDLVALLPLKWTVNWVYRGIEDEAHGYYVLGDQEYVSLSTALTAQPRTDLPDIIKEHTFLVGRIIVQNGAATGTVESAFEVTFTSAGVTNHNDLANIEIAGATVTYGHINDVAQTIAGAKTFSDLLTISTLTDGTFSVTGGAFTGISSISDGTASWSSSNLSGFGTISGTTLTDGTASLTSGAWTGVTSISISAVSTTALNIDANNTDSNVWAIGSELNGFYGYWMKYVGTGAGNANYLELWADDEGGTDTRVWQIDQDGHTIYNNKNVSGIGSLTATTLTDGTASITGGVITGATNTNWDAAYTHVSSNGSDHTYINQDVTTTGTPTFATVDTGQGANELYAMDQAVQTSDNVTFNQVTSTLSATSILANGVTATTQSASDNSTKVATTAYVDAAVLVEDYWNRTGDDISPKNAGDDILKNTTGDLGASGTRWDNIFGTNINGTTITDGTLSINSGSITSAVNGTFSGTVQAEQLTSTDDINATGIITGGSLSTPDFSTNANGIVLPIRGASTSHVVEMKITSYDTLWFYNFAGDWRFWNDTDNFQALLIDGDTGNLTCGGDIIVQGDDITNAGNQVLNIKGTRTAAGGNALALMTLDTAGSTQINRLLIRGGQDSTTVAWNAISSIDYGSANLASIGSINCSTITTTGDIDVGGDVNLDDDAKVAFGNSYITGQTGTFLEFYTNGNERLVLGTTAAVFNQDSLDYDLRVEGNNQANLFFCDAGNDRVGIGTNGPTTLVDIVDSGTPVFTVRTSSTSSQEATIRIRGARTTSTTSDVAQLEFYNDESGGAFQMAEIATRNDDSTSGTSHSKLIMKVNNGTSVLDALTLDSNLDALFAASMTITGDLRINGNTVRSGTTTTHKIELDAATDEIDIHPGDGAGDNFIRLTSSGTGSADPKIMPSADNEGHLGGSSNTWNTVYYCTLTDGTCVHFDPIDGYYIDAQGNKVMKNYTKEVLYTMFNQIKPLSDDYLHHAPGSNYYYPHIDMSTLPFEFASLYNKEHNPDKSTTITKKIPQRQTDGSIVKVDKVFNEGDAIAIDRTVQGDALIALVLRDHEWMEDLENRIKALEAA